MKDLSRYILIFITVLSLSVVLPWIYWLSFEKPIYTPFVMYSCVDDCFMIRNYGSDGSSYTNEKGESFTREEFEQKLPLLNLRQLMISNTLPDTIKGVEMDPHTVNMARSFFRLKPRTIKSPKPGLYPLFESESGRAQLEMPEDFFRIGGRMEFINAGENTVNEEKTRLFTGALQHFGFSFPAKMVEGIPTTRKSCDEGYFVVDNENQMFHVKMEQGKPYVRKIKIPKGLTFKHIGCVDFRNKEFYCYLVGHDNSLFVITQDDYELLRLPVEGYNPDDQELRIYGDLFNYNVIMIGEDRLKVTVLDDDFLKVDDYQKSWNKRSVRPEGKAFSYIFPVEINLTNKYNSYIDFYFYPTNSFNWLILHVLLVIVQLVIIRRRKANPKNHIVDFGIVLISGIFGFLAINIFPNKFYD